MNPKSMSHQDLFQIIISVGCHRTARAAGGLIATGKLQRERCVIHVIVDTVADLSHETSHVRNTSRDFR